MNAVRHVERRPTGASKSGRPGHFPRERLLDVSRHLKAVLAKRYRDRVSLSTLLEEILEASDQLMGVIHKIRLKRKQQSDKEKGDKRFLL